MHPLPVPFLPSGVRDRQWETQVAHQRVEPAVAGASRDVARNRRLNALVCDLSLPLAVSDTARQEWDRERVHELFDALEFRVLRERLLELSPQEPVAAGAFAVEGTTLDPGDVRAWLDAHAQDLTGVHFVGSWGSGAGDLTGIALQAPTVRVPGSTLPHSPRTTMQRWPAWSEDPTPRKVVHEAKGPTLAWWSRGWNLAGIELDTLLAAYLLRPDQRTYDLADLVLRHLKRRTR